MSERILHREAKDTGNCTVVTSGDIEKQRCVEIHKQQSGARVGGSCGVPTAASPVVILQ